METPVFNELLAQLADVLARNTNAAFSDCVLLGSAVLAARGLRDVHDLDVLVPPELFAELRNQERLLEEPYGNFEAYSLRTDKRIQFFHTILCTTAPTITDAQAYATAQRGKRWQVLAPNLFIEIKRRLVRLGRVRLIKRTARCSRRTSWYCPNLSRRGSFLFVGAIPPARGADKERVRWKLSGRGSRALSGVRSRAPSFVQEVAR